MHVLLVGAYPPPIGGVSVHVKRLLENLIRLGVEARVLDYSSRQSHERPPYVTSLKGGLFRDAQEVITLFKSVRSRTVIHFHVSAMGRFKWAAPVMLLLFRNQPKVITIHSGSFVAEMVHGLQSTYLRWMLRRFDKVITVSVEQADSLKKLGCAPTKLEIVPAYISQRPDPNLLPSSIAAHEGKRQIVLTSGYLTPLYNYDCLIDCIPKLNKNKYVFVFAFYNKIDDGYKRHIYSRLELFDNIIVLVNQTPEVFLSIMSASEIYVRSTLTDGDAVAIREALGMGKRVFASQCVTRPEGCYLFPADSSETLLSLFTSSAKDLPISIPENTANLENILRIYQEIAGTLI